MNRCFTLSRSLALGAFIALIAPFTVVHAQDARKDPTDATRAANAKLLEQLPFSDTSDFESAKKGLVAPLPSEMIQGRSGNLVWDPTKYGFIKEGEKAPDSVNPSLWRQSQLINSRDTLNKIILQEAKLTDMVQSGALKIKGDRAKLDELLSNLDRFEFWFNIVTP